jgi:hypothetical protein
MAMLFLMSAMAVKSIRMLWDDTAPDFSSDLGCLHLPEVDQTTLSDTQVELRADAIEALAQVGLVGISVEGDVDKAMVICPGCDLQGIVNIVVQLRGSKVG